VWSGPTHLAASPASLRTCCVDAPSALLVASPLGSDDDRVTWASQRRTSSGPTTTSAAASSARWAPAPPKLQKGYAAPASFSWWPSLDPPAAGSPDRPCRRFGRSSLHAQAGARWGKEARASRPSRAEPVRVAHERPACRLDSAQRPDWVFLFMFLLLKSQELSWTLKIYRKLYKNQTNKKIKFSTIPVSRYT
jgi:hypothetical protein